MISDINQNGCDWSWQTEVARFGAPLQGLRPHHCKPRASALGWGYGALLALKNGITHCPPHAAFSPRSVSHSRACCSRMFIRLFMILGSFSALALRLVCASRLAMTALCSSWRRSGEALNCSFVLFLACGPREPDPPNHVRKRPHMLYDGVV